MTFSEAASCERRWRSQCGKRQISWDPRCRPIHTNGSDGVSAGGKYPSANPRLCRVTSLHGKVLRWPCFVKKQAAKSWTSPIGIQWISYLPFLLCLTSLWGVFALRRLKSLGWNTRLISDPLSVHLAAKFYREIGPTVHDNQDKPLKSRSYARPT